MVQPYLCLPAEHGDGVLEESVGTLAVPGALLDTDLLLAVHVASVDVVSIDGEDLHLIAVDTLDLSLEVLGVVGVDNNSIDIAIITQGSRDIEVGNILDTTKPAKRGRGEIVSLEVAIVEGRRNVSGDSVAAHVLAEEKVRPPGGLLDDAILSCHQGRDDVNALGDTGHTDILRLADEDVHPDSNSEGIRQCV